MDSNIKNTLSVISFLDILGGKKLIDKNADESLNLVYTSYTEAIKEYEKRANPNLSLPRIKIFSDNISISFCIDDSCNNTFECILSVVLFCNALTVRFWSKGLLVRGGITIGYCFSDDFMVWGKALVRAYEIENTIAIYPRIVIDPHCEELFDFLSKSKYKKMICRDFDGLYFIDPLYSQKSSEIFLFLEKLMQDNQKRIDDLDIQNLKERQKLNWLQNYFNEKYTNIKKYQ